MQSLEELKTKEAIVGTSGPGSGSNDLSILARDVLGLKYRIVRGYKSGTEINIAMERGEVHAQIVGWDSLKAQRPEWVRDKTITIIGHFSLEDPPDLRPFARIVDLARTEFGPAGAPPGAGPAGPWPPVFPAAGRAGRRVLRRCAAHSTRPCATRLSSPKRRR